MMNWGKITRQKMDEKVEKQVMYGKEKIQVPLLRP